MNPKTEQILEVVRELREARAKGTKSEWVLFTEHMRHWQNDIISSDENGEFVLAQMNRNMPEWKSDAEFICLAANKIDQLCEALEVCIEAIEDISSGIYESFIATHIAERGLEKAAEILGRGEK